MKKFMKIFSKIFTKRQGNAGMSMVEMTLAGFFSVIVIGGSGTGLASIMRTQTEIANQVDRRLEVNRALNFITEESREARKVEVANDDTGKPINLADVAPTFAANISGYDYTVFLLELPDVSERVVYYMETPATNSIWRGPKVVYRWGPKIDANGNYIDANTPANWTSEPLIDLIDDTTSSPNCPTGWLVTPRMGATPTGFYGCVNPSGKAIEVILNSQTLQVTGSTSTEIYEGDKTVIAMANSLPTPAGSPPPLVSNPIAGIPTCTITNGALNCDGPGTVTVEVLGSGSACNPAKPFIVSTSISIDGQDQGLFLTEGQSHSFQIDSSNEVKVISTKNGNPNGSDPIYGNTPNYPSSCRVDKVVVSDDTDPDRLLILRDGDVVPTEYEPMFDQNSIEEYVEGYIDNNTIVLDESQIIYLYELAYNINNNNHDMQDNVVLVTIDTPSN